jgi:rSAM/selenodomain-associated transferase 2
MPVAVIIPTLNEEEWIAGAITSAREAGASEVIVVDGGSVDRTPRFATAAGARVILTEAMRARQMNLGAAAALSDYLIFLHADSRLPAGAAAAVEISGVAFGGFRIRFAEPDRKLRLAAAMINFRSAVTRQPWGDQAQFVTRSAFPGFPEIPIMEDYELARRMKRTGATRILPMAVTTSGRRFLKKGLLYTAAINWSIIVRHHLGVSPKTLAKMYRQE